MASPLAQQMMAVVAHTAPLMKASGFRKQRNTFNRRTTDVPFKIEAWSKDGQRIDRLLATATNIGIARGAYDAAVALFTGEWITLRQGERVVSETKARS